MERGEITGRLELDISGTIRRIREAMLYCCNGRREVAVERMAQAIDGLARVTNPAHREIPMKVEPSPSSPDPAKARVAELEAEVGRLNGEIIGAHAQADCAVRRRKELEAEVGRLKADVQSMIAGRWYRISGSPHFICVSVTK